MDSKKCSKIPLSFKDIQKYFSSCSTCLELEYRLGTLQEGTFNSNIGLANFNLIKSTFDKSTSKGIFTYQYTDQTDSYRGPYRITKYKDGETLIILKKRLLNHNISIEEHPLDIRFSVSSEEEILSSESIYEESISENKTRHKKRHSYTYGSWRYDLTEVDTPFDTLYEFELELLENTEEVFEKSYVKILDILKLIEKKL
jgi:hypothetical protein